MQLALLTLAFLKVVLLFGFLDVGYFLQNIMIPTGIIGNEKVKGQLQ